MAYTNVNSQVRHSPGRITISIDIMFEAFTGKRSKHKGQRGEHSGEGAGSKHDGQSDHDSNKQNTRPKKTREQVEADLLKSVCERSNSALTTVIIIRLLLGDAFLIRRSLSN